jgi:hypothetical protein
VLIEFLSFLLVHVFDILISECLQRCAFALYTLLSSLISSILFPLILSCHFSRFTNHAFYSSLPQFSHPLSTSTSFPSHTPHTHHALLPLSSSLSISDSNWSRELEKLRNRPIGVLEVDSKRLKNELVPLREARLQEIKEYVKDLAR